MQVAVSHGRDASSLLPIIVLNWPFTRLYFYLLAQNSLNWPFKSHFRHAPSFPCRPYVSPHIISGVWTSFEVHRSGSAPDPTPRNGSDTHSHCNTELGINYGRLNPRYNWCSYVRLNFFLHCRAQTITGSMVPQTFRYTFTSRIIGRIRR
jgi:hypothetical protein